jgi:tRNA dimethylallyltransferase
VGKTDAAIELAQRIGGEIVSADSMQVYRTMDIGTAKPGPEERARAAFHLIDIATPDQQVTVSQWKELAESAIADIEQRDRTAIVCGGTGLYIRALLDGWSLARTPADPKLRAQLTAKASVQGAQSLHRELSEVDPVTASRLHPNDLVRIVRALEVFHTSGSSISEIQAQDRSGAARRPAVRFGLRLPRPELYRRIEARVVQMFSAGLEQEVTWLLGHGYDEDLGPMRSLGYKETLQYLRERLTFDECVCAVKQSTRRYAKRQETWFKADPEIEWIDVTALSSATVASRILDRLDRLARGPQTA